MKRWLASIIALAVVVGSIGLARDDDGGGGGGVYTERGLDELRQVLADLRQERAASHHNHAAAHRAADSMAALGRMDFQVSCSPEAQAGFNRGLGLLHHMMYVEAEAEFMALTKLEPSCAMAHWGIAMTLFQPLWAGQPSQEALQRGREEIALARSLNAAKLEADIAASLSATGEPSTEPQTLRERAYILALEPFYREVDATYGSRLQAFETGMQGLYASYPDDLDAAAFYALSLLVTAPTTDKTLANQIRAAEILETVLSIEPLHPGGIHYAIHAHDFPPLAALATELAHSYDQIAPDVPHALHMPSHIFVRLGEWDGTISWNLRSAEAALKLEGDGPLQFHYAHAKDYVVYAYLQQGADEAALGVMEEVNAKIHLSNFASAYAFAAMPARYALERRQWQEGAALAAREPSSITWDSFPELEAITYFAKGIGAARHGDIVTAQEALETLFTLQEKTSEAGNMYWAEQIEIQRLAVAAWLEHARGNHEVAVALMLASADLEDATEKHPVTPGAVLPARELLGDLYLELGQAVEALEAYEASLLLSPNRLNSLLGAARAAELAGNPHGIAKYYSRAAAQVNQLEPVWTLRRL